MGQGVVGDGEERGFLYSCSCHAVFSFEKVQTDTDAWPGVTNSEQSDPTII